MAACAATPPPAVAEKPSLPEATPDLPPEPAPAATSSAASPAAPEQVCNAMIDEPVQHQLAQRAAESRHCYEQLLHRDPKRHGRMVISVRLDGAGQFLRAAASVDEVGDPEHTQCVLSQFKAPLDATISGNCADVNIPLRFAIKKDPPEQAPSGGTPPGDPPGSPLQ
jgi:hypothetical protein